MKHIKLVLILLALANLLGCSSNRSMSSEGSRLTVSSGAENVSSIISENDSSSGLNSQLQNSQTVIGGNIAEKNGAEEGSPKSIVSSQIVPFGPKDIYIDGTVVQSDSGKRLFSFAIGNLSDSYDLNGIMVKTLVRNLPNYNMNGIQGGKVSIEKGNYVWRFPQVLARNHAENVTIECTAESGNVCGFIFYTYDGKIQIDTCQIVA